MTAFGSDFDQIRREAEVRSLGADLYREAARISTETVESVAAALSAVANRTGSQVAIAVSDEYGKEMMAEAAERAYQRATLT